MSSLQGSRELKTRLKALKTSFKPMGRSWAEATRDEARRRSEVRTGRQRKSIRVRNSTQRKATVVGFFTVNFQDAGAKPHIITPKRADRLAWSRGGRTIFAKKVRHPGRRARPFKAASAQEGLRKAPLSDGLVKAWNEAA